MSTFPELESKELRRQQLLLSSVLNEKSPDGLAGWAKPLKASNGCEQATFRAWQVYVANAHASSERALAATFPTVQRLMGDEPFANMARAYLHAQPPSRGDLAWLGEALPGFIECSAQLESEPYLADTARLDWAVGRCEVALDADPDLATLTLLGECDPAQLRLQLAPGTALITSPHPIASIWSAHHCPSNQEDPFAPVRAAFASQQGESALVWRQGWRAQVQNLSSGDAVFLSALLAGATLGLAMDEAGADWNFESWLLLAASCGLLIRASRVS